MNFKNFKKEKAKKEAQTRSSSVEMPKLLKQHKGFFEEVKSTYKGDDYNEWEADALFLLFLKPEMEMNELLPENINNYIEKAQNPLINQLF